MPPANGKLREGRRRGTKAVYATLGEATPEGVGGKIGQVTFNRFILSGLLASAW